MKKTISSVVAGSLMAAGLACAQTGLAGGQEGLHQHTANTLGQWGFSFAAGGDVSFDNYSLASGGVMTTDKGQTIELNESAISISANVSAAIGFTNWFDMGVSFPIYFDMATDKQNRLAGNNMTDIGIGDLEAWAKFRIVGKNDSFFKLALLANFYAPTGSDDAGIRPRHSWYLSWTTKAYTGDEMAAGLSAILSLHWSKVHWNTQVGYVQPFDFDYDNYSGAITYSTGLTFKPASMIDLFLELSGEAHTNDFRAPFDPAVDPMIVTPGARFHLSDNIDLALGVDIGARIVKNLDYDAEKDRKEKQGFEIYYKDDKGTLKYDYSSTPLLAATANLTWNFGGHNDKAAKEQARIDSLVKVMAEKIAQEKLDSALKEMKPVVRVDTLTKTDTLAVTKTDTLSITKTDTLSITKTDTVKVVDLVADSLNKAKMDSIAAVSDSLARLSADDDKDGIPNMSDKCPDTKPGIVVGADGCEVDTDGDGVVDSQDKCPASTHGAPVDAEGCELDEDGDGIVDAKDACPATLSGVNIDEKGCPTNKDEDLTKLQALIKFGKGNAKIAKSSNKTLDKIAKLMIAREALRIEIQAHTDEKGADADANMELSQKRAQAVVDYLVKKGVPSKHVRAAGMGSTQLVVPQAPAKKGKKVKSNPKNVRVVLAAHTKKPKAEAAPAAAPAAQPAADAAPAPAAK